MVRARTANPGGRKPGPRPRLTAGQIVDLVDAYEAGHETVESIAGAFGISRQHLYTIVAQEKEKRALAGTSEPATAHLKEGDVNQRIDDSTSARPSASAPKEDLHDANN